MDWRICLLALLHTVKLITGQEGHDYDTDTNITSPNFPKPFPGKTEKVYKIHIKNHQEGEYIVAYFETFDILADPDNPDAVTLTVEDHRGHLIGQYSKSAPPGFVTKTYKYGPTLKIRFRSHVEGPVNVTGFKMYFKRKNSSEIVGNSRIEGKSEGHIASPGYPLNFPINSRYEYNFNTPLQDGILQFSFKDLDLGEGATIYVYDADNHGTPYLIYSFQKQDGLHWRYYLSGNVMTLVLYTGLSPTQRGFNLTYIEYCRVSGAELPCSQLPHSAMTNVIIFVVSITGILAFILLLAGCSVYCKGK